MLLHQFLSKSHDLGLIWKPRWCNITCIIFRLLSILFDLWQANLSKVTKHWDSFLSHCSLGIRHGWHHHSTWAQQLCMWGLPLGDRLVAIRKSLGNNVGAIPRNNRSAALVTWWNNASHSRFILGWICTTSTVLPVESHSISGIAEPAFFCYSSCPPCLLSYSSCWVLFPRDGHHTHTSWAGWFHTTVAIPMPLGACFNNLDRW
jgi:hypothetical protein